MATLVEKLKRFELDFTMDDEVVCTLSAAAARIVELETLLENASDALQGALRAIELHIETAE